MRAAELSSGGFRNPLVAVGAGRRRRPLIDQHHLDARLFGLVTQRPRQVGAAPLAQPQVMRCTRVVLRDAFGVADDQGADVAVDRPRHHLPGRLMMRVADTPAMPRLLLALAGAQLAPPATPTLSPLPRFAAEVFAALAGIVQVHAGFGADRPPGHHQRLILARNGEGVDDPQIDTCEPLRIQIVVFDGEFGGDVQPQPTRLTDEGDRPDLLDLVRHVAGQPHPQRRAAASRRDPHPSPIDAEGAVIRAAGSRRAGDPAMTARILSPLGFIELQRGNPAGALEHVERAIHRELEDRTGVADNLDSLAAVRFLVGQIEPAKAQFRESAALMAESGSRMLLSAMLLTLAFVENLDGRYGRAARLLGASVRQGEELGGGPPIFVVPAFFGDPEADARRALGDEECERQCAEGYAISLDDAVAVAVAGSA